MTHQTVLAKALTTVVVALHVCACGGVGEGGEAQSENPALSENPDLSVAGMFVDAFYSFDPDRLAALLSSAGESRPRILAYQAWAEGGHYEVIERMPCQETEGGLVACSITVRDDLVAELDLGWWVTDRFELSFEDGEIASVTTSSNDPQVYFDARNWVRENRAELVGPACAEDPDTGLRLTPGLCADAMAQGYREFAASEDFPDELRATPGG